MRASGWAGSCGQAWKADGQRVSRSVLCPGTGGGAEASSASQPKLAAQDVSRPRRPPAARRVCHIPQRPISGSSALGWLHLLGSPVVPASNNSGTCHKPQTPAIRGPLPVSAPTLPGQQLRTHPDPPTHWDPAAEVRPRAASNSK